MDKFDIRQWASSNSKTTLDKAAIEGLALFYDSFISAGKSNNHNIKELHDLFLTFAKMVIEQSIESTPFELYHQSTRAPFDHYKLGLDFVEKVLKRNTSIVINAPLFKQIEEQIACGDNVIFFSNHQTEIDPQVIQLLIEKEHAQLAEEMIFVAGHRVTTDPFAIPISLGCNLLCIYSKKHMGKTPEQAKQRLSHNRKTIRKLSELLDKGSRCIYVAPSGGRDRPRNGSFQIDPFDPQSLDLFYLLARSQKNTITHFYPLALYTHPLLPPPDKVLTELGEPRLTQASNAGIAIGQEIDRSEMPKDKQKRLEWIENHTKAVESTVQNLYDQLEKSL